MNISQVIALGYGIDQITAESLCESHSLTSKTKWTQALEDHFTTLLGWEYDQLAVNALVFEETKKHLKVWNKKAAIEDNRRRLGLVVGRGATVRSAVCPSSCAISTWTATPSDNIYVG